MVIAALVLLLGIAALGFSRRTGKFADRAATWFGIFATLYGVRLLADNGTFQALANLPESPCSWLSAVITYFIPIPGTLFVREIFPSWASSLRWLVRAQWIIGLFEISVDLLRGRSDFVSVLNNVLVLSVLAVFLFALFRRNAALEYARPVRAGLLVFCFTAVLANLASLGLFSLPINVEQFGFAVFLGSLARVVILRALASSERLAALDQELEIATRIQLSILPRQLPESPHYRIAASYLPMREVGGDFYDFLVVDERRIGILVADVSGHGIPAALIASMVKVAIASQRDNASDPARVLDGMNQALSGRVKGQFVTAAYLFLDLVQQRLHYAAAGHPPLLRCSRSTVEPVQENGFVLGFSARTRYRTLEAGLRSGERFLLYTDGLTEAHNEAVEEFGMDRLSAVLAQCSGSPPQQCVERTMQAVADWVGHERGRSPEDDLTLVVIELTGNDVGAPP